MTLKDMLILPADVEMVPVRSLAPDIRARLDARDDDYALTRLRSRTTSRVVDADSAALLERFREPTRIVDAVLAFARQRGHDPRTLLEQAYPLLYRMYDARLLVPAAQGETDPPSSGLAVGMEIAGFRLLRCVQALEDTEVYLGRDDAGAYAAIKYCRRPSERMARMMGNEADVLSRVPGRRAPRVLHLSHDDDGMLLVSEWVVGADIAGSAAGLRGRREPRNEQRLLVLLIETAQAYAELHGAGVLHGDIHPNNILVEPGGFVRLIDFGLAQDLYRPGNGPDMRGGVAFYLDPETAAAQREHGQAPLSAAGEQYSLAALLYQLWTGAHYIDWNLERGQMLRQIIEQPPASFESRGIAAWPELEATLARALDKHPEQRFPTMAALAEALRSLLPEAEARSRRDAAQRRVRARETELLDSVLQRYELGGSALANGIAAAPLASLTYGSGGVAYALLRIAERRGDAHLLALADLWIDRALAQADDERAFYNAEINVDRSTVGDVSLFHSIAGLHCVRALVSIALGDLMSAGQAIHRFIEHTRRPCEDSDLTLGTASLLIGCAELLEALSGPQVLDITPIRARGDEIARDLRELLASDSIATSTYMTSLGIAHGWAGILFALLRWTRSTGATPEPILVDRLRELAALAEPHGGGQRWAVSNANAAPSFLDGWCNGTAGHVMLFALAGDVLASDEFVPLVERAAESAWSGEAQIGTLCCGLAGIGYAFLAAYRVTGSALWLERARSVARRAAADTSEYFYRDALYKGAVGVAVLTEDLKRPQGAAMPLFEPTI